MIIPFWDYIRTYPTAAAQSLSHVQPFFHTRDCSLPGPSVRGVSQARILEWAAMSSSRGSSQLRDQTHVCCIVGRFFTTEPPGKPSTLDAGVLSHLSHVQLFVTPWTVAHQVTLSMDFSRQEYWSGLPFPPPGDLPDPGMEPSFPALQVDSL